MDENNVITIRKKYINGILIRKKYFNNMGKLYRDGNLFAHIEYDSDIHRK